MKRTVIGDDQIGFYRQQNDEPIEIEYVEDEHDESKDFEPSFWYRNRRYYLSDFTKTHNNPWNAGSFPDEIDGMNQDYYYPLFIQLVDDSAVNVFEEENEAKAGDVIIAKGMKRTIKEIVYQDYWRGMYTVEGKDINNDYFMWKQEFDGGHLYKK